jgi:hypothetical protein
VLGPLSELARARHGEYVAQETREARFARLCDKLQLGVQLLAYLRAGVRGLGEFLARLESLDAREFAGAEDLRRAILAQARVALEGDAR